LVAVQYTSENIISKTRDQQPRAIASPLIVSAIK